MTTPHLEVYFTLLDFEFLETKSPVFLRSEGEFVRALNIGVKFTVARHLQSMEQAQTQLMSSSQVHGVSLMGNVWFRFENSCLEDFCHRSAILA